MRKLVVLIALSACSKSAPPEAQGSGSAPAPVTTTAQQLPATGVALDHITLLEPEAILQPRLKDQDAVTATLKEIPTIVARFDEANPGVLPANFDVVIVMRPAAMRGWIVSDAGDVAAPALAQSLAALPSAGVRAGNVAAVLTMVRAGTKVTEGAPPRIPAAWKASAGSGGTKVDDIIDKVWPN